MKRLQLSLFNQFCEEQLSKSLPGSKIKSSGFVSFINNCFEVLKTQPVCYWEAEEYVACKTENSTLNK